MNNNPEFLNDFLKYSAYITFKSNLTVDEMYLDIRTFFRYLIFSKNRSLHNIHYRNLKKYTFFCNFQGFYRTDNQYYNCYLLYNY